MLSNDKNVETLSQLIEMLKHNFELRTEFLRLDATAKVARLLSVATLVLILFIIVLAAVFFASAALALWLSQWWGLTSSLLAVSGLYLLLLLVVYKCRNAWIERPLVRFLSQLLMN